MATSYRDFHRRSLEDREGFWAEQAKLVDWHKPFDKVLDYQRPPFARWFVGGLTNLCHNAVDRHLGTRASQNALIYISTETGEQRTYTFRDLHAEVNRCAGMVQSLGVGKGDRVLIYMPMVPEAIFMMLATVRIGAIHSVVFGGFAAHSLAARIDDARPQVMVIADAGMRMGKVIDYKPLVDDAIRLAQHPPAKVIVLNRGLDKEMKRSEGRDLDYAELRSQHLNAQVPVTWLESNEPSYILYTSGTTGQPKGVIRHRLGGGALVHRLRTAHWRHDDSSLRRRADSARSRHLVEDRSRAQGLGDVLGAHCDSGVEEAGSGLPEEVRLEFAQVSFSRGRAIG
jgi:propionyl-CoA synthetase